MKKKKRKRREPQHLVTGTKGEWSGKKKKRSKGLFPSITKGRKKREETWWRSIENNSKKNRQ